MRAGGEAALLYLAWKHAGINPYCLFHGLGEDFRPWGQPDADPEPPPFPSRLRGVIYGFASFSAEQDSGQRARQPRPER